MTVLRSPNVSLSYDDNDFTLINNTGGSIDFNGLVFGIGGRNARRFFRDALGRQS